jgi:hypothetical protein
MTPELLREHIRGAVVGLVVGIDQQPHFGGPDFSRDAVYDAGMSASPHYARADAAADRGPVAVIVRRADDAAVPVAGLLAGLIHGYGALPLRWRANVANLDELLAAADRVADAILPHLAPCRHVPLSEASGPPPTAVVPARAVRRQHCTALNEIGEAGA